MTDKQDECRGDFSAAGPDEGVISDRVQELTWALLDEQMNDDEFILLENLLLADDKARGTYLGCTQLHADLMAHFSVPTGTPGSNPSSGSQILGFLSSDAPLGLQSPSAEESATLDRLRCPNQGQASHANRAPQSRDSAADCRFSAIGDEI